MRDGETADLIVREAIVNKAIMDHKVKNVKADENCHLCHGHGVDLKYRLDGKDVLCECIIKQVDAIVGSAIRIKR